MLKKGIVSRFPASWRTDVVVRRNGGTDPKGYPLPDAEIPVSGCLIGARSTNEPVPGNSLTSSDMSIYRDPDPAFRFQPDDQVVVPEGAMNSGTWSVDGRQMDTPLGCETPVKAGV